MESLFDVETVRKLRETDVEFRAFHDMLQKWPYWKKQARAALDMFYRKRGGMKRKREGAAVLDDDSENSDDDNALQKVSDDEEEKRSLETLGMVPSTSAFRISREERMKASKVKKRQNSSRDVSDSIEKGGEQEVKEDISTKMLRLRGFKPTHTKPKAAAGTNFARKLRQNFIDEKEEEEEEEEEEEDRSISRGEFSGGFFLEKKNLKKEHKLPHEEFQTSHGMSEEDALKLALSLSMDEYMREELKRKELEELENLDIARALSQSQSKQKYHVVDAEQSEILSTLLKLGFETDVAGSLAFEVIPVMTTREDVFELLGTLGCDKTVTSNIASIFKFDKEQAEFEIEEEDVEEEEEVRNEHPDDELFNAHLSVLTNSFSNADLLAFLRDLPSRSEAGVFLRESFGGTDRARFLSESIWQTTQTRNYDTASDRVG